MREIKFRAIYTDNGHNEWRYSDYDETGFWYGISDGQISRDTLCQFTGLKDKNGKEIYEGDFLKIHNDTTCEPTLRKVIFVKAQFIAEKIKNDPYRNCWHIGVRETQEVVGNVFENPELL